MRALAYIFGFLILSGSTCRTCDCFDEPDYAFGCVIDIKKLMPGMSVSTFLMVKDSVNNPKNYSLKVYSNDSTFYMYYLDWHGDGKGDSIVYFNLWDPTDSKYPVKKATIDIPAINFHHKLSDFHLEGKYAKGSCPCFTPTKKTMVLDDSLTVGEGVEF